MADTDNIKIIDKASSKKTPDEKWKEARARRYANPVFKMTLPPIEFMYLVNRSQKSNKPLPEIAKSLLREKIKEELLKEKSTSKE